MIRLTICEFATGHRDGTFSVVRGGIEFIELAVPGPMTVWILVELPPDVVSSSGPVEFEAEATMPLGVTSKLQGFSIVTDPKKPGRFAFPLTLQLGALGMGQVEFRMGTSRATAPLEVRAGSSASVAPPSSS